MFKNFKEVFSVLPQDLKKRVYGLKDIPQNPEHHPEGNTLKHVIITVQRAIKIADNDLIAAAIFHDIGKDETFEINPKTGKPTAHGHEEVSAKLVLKYRKFIRNVLQANPVVVYYIVRKHMKIKNFAEMRKSKQQFLQRNPQFNKLDMFSKRVDGGGRHLENRKK